MSERSGIFATLSGLYHALPQSWRQAVMPLAHRLRAWVDPSTRARQAWQAEHYNAFAVRERENIFLAIARLCHINRPIEGYYFEFGCHTARTMRLCWKHTRHLFNWRYVAFDSFEGLPEIEAIDRQEIWQKGRLKTEEDEFVDLVLQAGMPRDRLRTVRGFYDQTLTPQLAAELGPAKAAAIYVDCDLYLSTVPVLEFIKDFLQKGTIIVFDDWNCFNSDPDLGERRAFREFCERYPELGFEEVYRTAEGICFVHTGRREPSDGMGSQ